MNNLNSFGSYELVHKYKTFFSIFKIPNTNFFGVVSGLPYNQSY